MNKLSSVICIGLIAVSVAACSKKETEPVAQDKPAKVAENPKKTSKEKTPAQVRASITPTPDMIRRTIFVKLHEDHIQPTRMKVKRNERIRIAIADIDSGNGISIPALGITMVIPEGQRKTIALPTTKPGTYQITCAGNCPEGYQTSTITVLDEEISSQTNLRT